MDSAVPNNLAQMSPASWAAGDIYVFQWGHKPPLKPVGAKLRYAVAVIAA